MLKTVESAGGFLERTNGEKLKVRVDRGVSGPREPVLTGPALNAVGGRSPVNPRAARAVAIVFIASVWSIESMRLSPLEVVAEVTYWGVSPIRSRGRCESATTVTGLSPRQRRLFTKVATLTRRSRGSRHRSARTPDRVRSLRDAP